MESPVTTSGAFAHTSVEDCYQCGKCTAGCPMAQHMDVMPNQLLRLVQLDQVDKAMGSEAIWLCVSCQTCTARCPKSVDCAGVMDVLRQLAAEKGVAPAAVQRTLLFQKAFLDNIRRYGRVNEVALIMKFKMQVFFKVQALNPRVLLRDLPLEIRDAMLPAKMVPRGKFHILGEKVRDRGVVERIFKRCEEHAHSASLTATEGTDA